MPPPVLGYGPWEGWHGRPRLEGWPSGDPVTGGEAHAPVTKVMISCRNPGHSGGGGAMAMERLRHLLLTQ